MNLFSSKLRRTATVAGGAFAGLGVIVAMATPALACDTIIGVQTTCPTADGWNATWSVQNDFGTDAQIVGIELDHTKVDSIGDIKVGATVGHNDNNNRLGPALTGTSTFKGTDSHHLSVTLDWGRGRVDESSTDASQKSEGCTSTTPPTSTPVSTPPTKDVPPTGGTGSSTPPNSSAPATSATPVPTDTPTVPVPSESAPALPNSIYKADCSSVTIGLDNSKTPIEYKLKLVPTKGAEQDLDIKAGQSKSAKFAASGDDFNVKLTVVAVYKGVTSPPETATIPWEKPEDCSSGPVLAVTGSSTAPLAGGAAVVVLAGAGLFFMARRRKMKFTA